jgi:hypothetical protein
MDGKFALLYFIIAAAITLTCMGDENINAMKQAVTTMVVAQINGTAK